MAEIVNLNKARKARDRAADRVRASENRILHGRTKAETQQATLERLSRERGLDGHKRDVGDDD